MDERAVALKFVKARDSGSVFTGMEAEILTNASSPPTILDLESRCGSIRIKGDHLLVKAKADGGGIEYAGRLAAGLHSFETGPFAPHADAGWRLPGGIRLTVPADMPFEVNAVATRGKILSKFPPTSGAPGEPSTLRRTFGADPKVKLELRSVDGPIEIRQEAAEASSPGAGGL